MKLPKTVQINGKTYSVKTNKARWGGRFNKGKQEIGVGIKGNQSEQRKFDNFVHEVLEAILEENNFRYRASDEEPVFIMTHKEFDSFALDVTTAIFPMIKANV